MQDIRSRGGIISLQDLKYYDVQRKSAIVNQMGNMTWYTVPPPSSGPVITLVLNILKGVFFVSCKDPRIMYCLINEQKSFIPF